MNKFSMLAVTALFLCLACSATPPASALTAQDLSNRGFRLVMVDGQEFSSEHSRPFMTFTDSLTMNGKICNNFVGQGILQGNILSAPNMALTRMLCAEESVNQVETWFAQMLVSGAQISLDGPQLILQGQGHILEFEEQAP